MPSHATSPLTDAASHGPQGAAQAAAIARLQSQAGEATALLKTMANRDRLMILCHLLDGEHTVADIALLTGVVQPTLSQQLGVLRDKRLVATRRDGKFIHYRVASPAVLAVLQTLHAVYCAPAMAMHRTSPPRPARPKSRKEPA
jgi:DNA-binding transcriptional ArsR family regulator